MLLRPEAPPFLWSHLSLKHDAPPHVGLLSTRELRVARGEGTGASNEQPDQPFGSSCFFPLPPTSPSIKKLLQAAAARRLSGGATAPPDTPDWRLRRERPHRVLPPPGPPQKAPPVRQKCLRRAGGIFGGGPRCGSPPGEAARAGGA
eukprot:15440073-Alexandrium_andersonii.AAC.1